MRFFKLVWVAIFLFTSALVGQAQGGLQGSEASPMKDTATVVIYRPFTGLGHPGILVDGKEAAILTAWSYFQVKLPAGIHEFSSTLAEKHNNVRDSTKIRLEPRKTYYVELTMSQRRLIKTVIRAYTMEVRPTATALEALAKVKPIQSKYVKDAEIVSIDPVPMP
jgi:hypothetical protein